MKEMELSDDCIMNKILYHDNKLINYQISSF